MAAAMKRTLVLMAGLLLLLAMPARAMELDGKWGMGVAVQGLIGSYAEMSLIHGHSERTAYLIDLRLDEGESHGRFTYSDPSTIPYDESENFNRQGLLAGPRLRRFTRPNSDFSPYWDVYAHGIYNRNHSYRGSTSTAREYGADTGFALGAEYFTPWHFSVAAHSTLASFSWTHLTEDRVASYGLLYSKYTSTRQSFSLGVSPQMYVRVYF
jgi:hypothetical protein